MSRVAGSLGRLAALALPLALAACASRGASSPLVAPVPQVEPTRVVTHVVTHDAKLIGTAVGGVRVTVRDAASGQLLAQGIQEGGTGDTPRIMTEPRRRGVPVFETPGAARWVAELPLDTPTVVDVTAEGPLAYPDQLARASKRLLLVPGGHVEGDGIVLELHGYVIDLLAPTDSGGAPRAGEPIPVRTRVRLLCSCPTQPGGLWEVEEVTAYLVQGGTTVARVPLAYAGEASTYAGVLPPAPAGEYTVEVRAASPGAATFGRVRRELRLSNGR